MTTERTKPCSACKQDKPLSAFHLEKSAHDGRRAQCKQCRSAHSARHYADNRHAIRERRDAIRKGSAVTSKPDYYARAVTLRYCPDDVEMGVPMYQAPAFFTRAAFQGTLADGHWPAGAVFEYAPERKGERSRWTVSGSYIREVGTERVGLAYFKRDRTVGMRLLPAMARGAT